MSSASIGMNYGEAKRREAAARAKAERRQVDPETRAARAAVLERREALMAGQEAAAKAEKDAAPDALRAVLGRGTVDELAEIARMISRLDGRRMQDLVNEVFREKSRTGHVQAPDSTVQTRLGRKAPLRSLKRTKAASESLRPHQGHSTNQGRTRRWRKVPNGVCSDDNTAWEAAATPLHPL